GAWKLSEVRRIMRHAVRPEYVRRIQYRPFDYRYIFYHRQMLEGPREKLVRHFLQGANVALAVCRQVKSSDVYRHVFVTSAMAESSLVSNYTSEIAQICPLYVYRDDAPVSNLNAEIVARFAERLGVAPPEREAEYTGREFVSGVLQPIDVFDYVYGVLFDPEYRERYAELLKIDFPRIPYPQNLAEFDRRRSLGKELRLLHLLEHPQATAEGLNEIDFPVPGDGRVENVRWIADRVYINDAQYFSGVTREVFDYCIGGYRPAQKWLADRKVLSFDDVRTYQKIVFAVDRTLELTRA
ncbi:MAG: type ISP restriction/modification enzyme, partial [Bacteroidia bacterium]|nr:type ISP restriction/modification enzyme [Bacteroidia bacterium]